MMSKGKTIFKGETNIILADTNTFMVFLLKFCLLLGVVSLAVKFCR